MAENRTVSLTDSLTAALRVAVVDTARNFFRPIHNARVILGYEHEPSFSEMIEEEENKIVARRREKNQTPSPR